MTEHEIWFRYEDVMYPAPLDEWGCPIGAPRLAVELRTFRVVKHTPCGVRLDTGRFVKISEGKMFAHPTKDAAKTSFVARKTRQARIYESRANVAHRAISMIQTDTQL